ncbi:NADH-quinone oxidoreductase subunit J [Dysgonomonas sp. 520]|uniref:NADH-quinone oxidoreductase subunit J family protein n=1 Tax=Dysgonomonas sp. 520 TaxID=2302931 RepID=UPI0013D67B39|nr:NADH-quinone oxidoreductase subunit J [Dysgonomonas sp. 520]NDW08617.1 NADH-quinone oxidoreductase subunit J [Dysgonomonas sp. 520]
MGEQIVFLILGAIIAGCSILAVTTQKIIRAATFLLFVLLATAGIYLLLDYHFLAMVQIAVYAGGIMVLFIFAILLTNQPGVNVKFEKPWRMFLAALAALSGLVICGHIIFYNVTKIFKYAEIDYISMQTIGTAMMGTDQHQYLLPFEAISLLLLACIIGGIMIARKR